MTRQQEIENKLFNLENVVNELRADSKNKTEALDKLNADLIKKDAIIKLLEVFMGKYR